MDKKLRVEFGRDDHPLVIGDISLFCYVLNNGQRVFSQGGLISGIGLKPGSAGGSGGDRLGKFASGNRIKEFINKDLMMMIESPVRFTAPNGRPAYGYDATVLAGLCEAVLAANAAGKLQEQQKHIIDRCKALYEGFARVGIIALVDEVTGYQEVRKKDELRKILEAYVNPEFLPWTKTFPDAFYEELYRLRNIPYDPKTTKRPQYLGKITEDIIYRRLPPGVLEELRKMNPKTSKGNRSRKHWQHLTEDIGNPHLKNLFIGVIALMRGNTVYRKFHDMLERVYPKANSQIEFEGFGFEPQEPNELDS